MWNRLVEQEETFFDFCEACENQFKCPQDMYFNPRDGCEKFEVRLSTQSAIKEETA